MANTLTIQPFNQTKMELKRDNSWECCRCYNPFNQTKMELKRKLNAIDYPQPMSFNQTKMELKLLPCCAIY